MDAKQFREAVQEMRSLQKKYFKSREFSTLLECKEAEKVVDEHLLIFEKENNAQKQLF